MNWSFFLDKELACHCGCGQAKMNTEFMQKLIKLREQLAFPFILSSAYRCASHNQKVSSTGHQGPHTTGRAVDIKVSGEQAYRLIQYAAQFGFTGIGFKQSGPHYSRYIHLDDLTPIEGFPRPGVWGY